MSQPCNQFKLHGPTWPGVVGKGTPGAEPALTLEQMLKLISDAKIDGVGFDGVDLWMYPPHVPPNASKDDFRRMADLIHKHGLKIGSLVAPVWPGTIGDSAMGSPAQRARFIDAVRYTCRAAQVFDDLKIRDGGVIRIDSATSPEVWSKDEHANFKRTASTFRSAGEIAAGYGQKIAAEGEICWGAMQSWQRMLNLLEEVDRPGIVGFQADMSHTLLYLMGYNAPEDALLPKGYNWDDPGVFYEAYAKLTNALRPWTMDFHVAQNDGTSLGTGNHDRTGRHCRFDDPNGKLDIVTDAGYWLQGSDRQKYRHICMDACMLPNAVLEDPQTWLNMLGTMIAIQKAYPCAI